MKLVKILKYKTTTIKIFDHEGIYPYSYSFREQGKIVKSRTTYNSIVSAISEAKLDFDMENN